LIIKTTSFLEQELQELLELLEPLEPRLLQELLG